MNFFLCKIFFNTHRIIIQDKKTHTKKSQKADLKGGGVNAYGQPDRKISVFLRLPLTKMRRINHDIDNSDWRLQSDIIYKNIESIISSLWEKQRAQSNTYLLHPAQPRETKFYVEATEDGKVRIFLLFKGNLLFLCMLQYRFKWKISSVWLRTQKKINNWQEY